MLHNIIVWTPVHNATIAIYDNVSGTSNPITILTLPAQATPTEIDFHVGFSTGLNIVPSSASLILQWFMNNVHSVVEFTWKNT